MDQLSTQDDNIQHKLINGWTMQYVEIIRLAVGIVIYLA